MSDIDASAHDREPTPDQETDGDPPAATSSSLEQADGAADDLEPRGEQGGPDDAA